MIFFSVWVDYDDPTKDGKYWALESFKTQFGEWYAAGAEVHQDMVFDFPGSELLLSNKLKESLTNWEKKQEILNIVQAYTLISVK